MRPRIDLDRWLRLWLFGMAALLAGGCNAERSAEPAADQQPVGTTCSASRDGGTCATCDTEITDEFVDAPDDGGGNPGGGGPDGGTGGPDGGTGGGALDGGSSAVETGPRIPTLLTLRTGADPRPILYNVRITPGAFGTTIEVIDATGTPYTVSTMNRPPIAMSGGRVTDGAAYGRARADGVAEANRISQLAYGRCPTAIRVFTIGARLGVVAIVMLAYGGYVSAAESASTNIIARWQSFYGDCQVLNTWASKSFSDWIAGYRSRSAAPTCSECYDAFFADSSAPVPGSGSLTVCSESFANPSAAFQGMVQDVGSRISSLATSCAAFAGGYYSQRFTTPLLLPDPPNVPAKSTVCPY